MYKGIAFDMDGLKTINDNFGHNEGDYAIKTIAYGLTRSVNGNEVCARAGGDEFYIFAVDYTDRLLERFHRMIRDALETLNQHSGKPYTVSLSCGAYIAEATSMCRIEDFLRVSDARMYEEKMKKKAGR